MAEAQRAAEAQRLLELERARELERQQAEAERLRREEELRMDWRRWTRRHFANTTSTSDAAGKGAGLRFAIRLPNGERVVHQFSLRDDDLTNLYAFVDSKLIPSDYPASEDPLYPPSSSSPSSSSAKDTLQSHILNYPSNPTTTSYWGFLIATSFPRIEVPWKEGTPLSSVEHLKGGGQLVVELISSRTNSPRPSVSSTTSSSANGSGSGEDSDDGYETED
jgi:FAS-associated factor 2